MFVRGPFGCRCVERSNPSTFPRCGSTYPHPHCTTPPPKNNNQAPQNIILLNNLQRPTNKNNKLPRTEEGEALELDAQQGRDAPQAEAAPGGLERVAAGLGVFASVLVAVLWVVGGLRCGCWWGVGFVGWMTGLAGVIGSGMLARWHHIVYIHTRTPNHHNRFFFFKTPLTPRPASQSP